MCVEFIQALLGCWCLLRSSYSLSRASKKDLCCDLLHIVLPHEWWSINKHQEGVVKWMQKVEKYFGVYKKRKIFYIILSVDMLEVYIYIYICVIYNFLFTTQPILFSHLQPNWRNSAHIVYHLASFHITWHQINVIVILLT